jgi:hypothetical protein
MIAPAFGVRRFPALWTVGAIGWTNEKRGNAAHSMGFARIGEQR